MSEAYNRRLKKAIFLEALPWSAGVVAFMFAGFLGESAGLRLLGLFSLCFSAGAAVGGILHMSSWRFEDVE